MTHPNDDTLLFYSFGTLDGAAATGCAEHLRTCRACASRYAQLGEGLEKLDAWKVEEDADAGALDAARDRALEALKSRTPSPAPAAAPIRAAVVPVAPSVGLLGWLGLKPGLEWRAMRVAVFAFAVLSVSWGAGGTFYFAAGPTPASKVTVEQVLLVGGTANVQVDAAAGLPVKVSLQTDKGVTVLFEGATGDDGSVTAPVVIPQVGGTQGIIESRVGEDVLHNEVQLLQRYSVHLGADKPAYQPGQTMHLRALVLRDPSLMPAAGQGVVLEVRDAKNVSIARRELTASQWGVVSFDLELGDDVTLGTWGLSASLVDVAATVTTTSIEVARYVLPRFKLVASPARDTWLAGEQMRVDVSARTFFGRPIVNAKVSALVVKRSQSGLGESRLVVAQANGVTDGDGALALTPTIPAGLAARGAETLALVLEATDAAGQTARTERPVTVARQHISVALFGDHLAVSVPGTVFVVTTRPDGRPVSCDVEVGESGSEPQRVRTGEDGIGAFNVTPTDRLLFSGRAVDALGQSARFEAAPLLVDGRVNPVVQTDKALYRPGEPIAVTLAVSDLVEARSEDGTLLSSTGVSGVRATLNLPRSYSGVVVLAARSSALARRVIVAPPSDLVVKLAMDKPVWRPGEEAKLRFQVTDANGKPKVAALGVRVVDEALYALHPDTPDAVRAALMFHRAPQSPTPLVPSVASLAAQDDWSSDTQQAARLALSFNSQLVKIAGVTTRDTATEHLAAFQEQRHSWQRVVFASLGMLALLALVALLRKLETFISFLLAGAIVAGAVQGLTVLMAGWVVAACVFSWLFLRSRRTIGLGFFVMPTVAFLLALTVVITARLPVLPDAPTLASTPMPNSRSRGPGPVPQPALAQRPLTVGNEASGKGHDDDFDAVYGVGKPTKTNKLLSPSGVGGLGTSGHLAGASVTQKEPLPEVREVRVREHFPETLYVHPQLIADESGTAELTVRLADSITDWRVTALANSADGKLGTFEAPLKVFQPFFVDLETPAALVRGDEATLPVTVHNFLDVRQDVRLEVQVEPWFEVLGPTKVTTSVAARAIEPAKLRIRVLEPGEHSLRVRADGTSQSDVVVRPLLVSEEGREDSVSVAGQLVKNKAQKVALRVPQTATGRLRLSLKLAPSLVASTLDGIEGLIRQPTGCFEQTSAKTWPNALVLRMLAGTPQLTPELAAVSQRYLVSGTARLLGFEARGGGFEWFGRSPASPVLTAFGVMEFADIAKVSPVDPAVLDRTSRWLRAQQRSDGSWQPDAWMLGGAQGELRVRLKVTAYIAWALAEANDRSLSLKLAQDMLLKNLDSIDDTYTLALVVAGLSKTGRSGGEGAVKALIGRGRARGEVVVFPTREQTLFYGNGAAADVESTALAAYALTISNREPQLVKKALDYVVSQRYPHGAWASTQATVLALKALLTARDTVAGSKVTVSVNGEAAQSLQLGTGRVRVFDAELHKGENVIELMGNGDVPYIATATFTQPWRSRGDADDDALALSVEYSVRQATVGAVVPVNARVTWRRAAHSGMALVSVGVPAGLVAIEEDLQALQREGRIAKYEVSAGSVALYVDKLAQGVTSFAVRLKATQSVQTKGAGSRVYLYYDPVVRALAAPNALVVN